MNELYFNVKGGVDYCSQIIKIISLNAESYECNLGEIKTNNEGAHFSVFGKKNKLIDVQSALKKLEYPAGKII